MGPEAQESELVQQAVAGDTVALTLLLQTTRRQLVERLTFRMPADLWGQLDPDDIVQEAHVAVFRNIRQFEPRGPDAFRRWVATIAVRKLRDALKARRSAKRGGGRIMPALSRPLEESVLDLLDVVAAPGRTPSRSAAGHERAKAVLAALDQLPEDQRRAIWLTQIEGLSAVEAAERMDRTEPAVQGLRRRGLERLRALLGSASAFLSTS